jgi:hypothetical protein
MSLSRTMRRRPDTDTAQIEPAFSRKCADRLQSSPAYRPAFNFSAFCRTSSASFFIRLAS